MKQKTYLIGGKKEIKLEDVRKMSDKELILLFDDIYVEAYSEGYDSGYDEAREECW